MTSNCALERSVRALFEHAAGARTIIGPAAPWTRGVRPAQRRRLRTNIAAEPAGRRAGSCWPVSASPDDIRIGRVDREGTVLCGPLGRLRNEHRSRLQMFSRGEDR
jgi:hypothetical protein